MPLPSWPVASYRPDLNTFQPIQRMLGPVSTDMEGGNTRQQPRTMSAPSRRRSGCRWPAQDFRRLSEDDTQEWRAAHFSTKVWLGSSYADKVLPESRHEIQSTRSP
jgi:hypothetical protein